jgi:hypothetical protein
MDASGDTFEVITGASNSSADICIEKYTKTVKYELD